MFLAYPLKLILSCHIHVGWIELGQPWEIYFQDAESLNFSNYIPYYDHTITFQQITVFALISAALLGIQSAQKRKFSIKDFFSKYDQIRRKLLLQKKSLMESFIFCAVPKWQKVLLLLMHRLGIIFTYSN